MPMKTYRWILPFACLFTSAIAGHESQSKLSKIIFDPAYFVSSLPLNTLVADKSPKKEAEPGESSVAKLNQIIKASNRDPKPKLYAFPESGTPPTPSPNRAAPVYPSELKRDGVTGSASFMVLVDQTGKVQGIYCFKSDQDQLAECAASAIARWTFQPAKIGTQAVPVVFFQSMVFEIR